MIRDRFLILLQCFHLSPKMINCDRKQSIDCLTKIRPLINYFNSKMNSIYYPKKELCYVIKYGVMERASNISTIYS